MLISDLLRTIRESWIKLISEKLGRSEDGKKPLADELNRFFDLLIQAVESGDPGWLKEILVSWSSSRTETDLKSDEISLSPILETVVIETIHIARNELSPEDGMELIDTLMPIFTYCYDEVAKNESLIRISYMTAELEKAQVELERLDSSKSDFISVAAHELKTPLTLIEGYSSMLCDEIGSEDQNSPQILLLKGIDNGTRRLGVIINDMIDVSLIDNNLLSLNFQPSWINRLIEVLNQEVKQTLISRKIELIINDFEGYDTLIYSDSERIYQALKNVFLNAIKYTPDKGTITVDGRLIGGFIEITIADTGIGIDLDDQDRIFEKFGRLGAVATHSSGKTKFKGGGPGLGLPITKGILEAHGGTIWVESPGYDEKSCPGSIFHILLPLTTEPPDEKVAKLFSPTKTIIEDDGIIT